MRRSASRAEKPHMPRPPRPPALLTAEASAGVLSHPMGACRIGHLRSSLSVNALRDHIGVLPGYLTKAWRIPKLSAQYLSLKRVLATVASSARDERTKVGSSRYPW